MPNETITISLEEYHKLLYESAILGALYRGGVDDWEWYEASLEALDDESI